MKMAAINFSVLTLAAVLAAVATPAVSSDHAGSAHHIHVATSHAGEAIKWYVEHLDCQAIEGRSKAINCGAMDIEFVVRQSLGGSQGTGVDHISFSYADVNAKMSELEGVGVRGSGGPAAALRRRRHDSSAAGIVRTRVHLRSVGHSNRTG